MVELARQRPRFGYRRIAALLRTEGWRAGETRVLRLWRREGLKVPQKSVKNDVWVPARMDAIDAVPSTRTMFGAGISCSIARSVVVR